jgi:hypothetical protein
MWSVREKVIDFDEKKIELSKFFVVKKNKKEKVNYFAHHF